MTDYSMTRQASSSRVPVITTNGHGMNRKFSDNMENEYSIEAFRQKLDELTESLDHNINFEKIIQDAKNTTPVKQIMSLQSQPQSAGMSAIASSSDDPILVQTAPQLRRLPMTAVTDFSDRATTTTNRTSRISSQQSSSLSSNRNTTRGIASPEPPTPVKTPLRRQNQYHHHPDRSTTPSSSVLPERRLPGPQPRTSTVESATTNPSPFPSTRTASSRPPDPSRVTMGATATTTPLPHPDTTTTTPETRMPPPQRQWNELYRTLQQHEERIRQLEYENDQAWLFQQQPSRQTTATYDAAGGSSSRSHRSSHRRRYPEDPGIRHFVSTTATPSFSSDHVRGGHDHHHQSNSNRPLGSTASPGQRFVEELVQIMDLPSDLHEPLSRIMDRQFYSGNGSL